jgi:hypothetical protein
MKSMSFIYILVSAVLTVLANLFLRYGFLKSGGLILRREDGLARWAAAAGQLTVLLGILFSSFGRTGLGLCTVYHRSEYRISGVGRISICTGDAWGCRAA